MYVYIYLFIYIYIHIYIYIYIYVYKYMHIYIYIYISVCVHEYISIYMFVHIRDLFSSLAAFRRCVSASRPPPRQRRTQGYSRHRRLRPHSQLCNPPAQLAASQEQDSPRDRGAPAKHAHLPCPPGLHPRYSQPDLYTLLLVPTHTASFAFPRPWAPGSWWPSPYRRGLASSGRRVLRCACCALALCANDSKTRQARPWTRGKQASPKTTLPATSRHLLEPAVVCASQLQNYLWQDETAMIKLDQHGLRRVATLPDLLISSLAAFPLYVVYAGNTCICRTHRGDTKLENGVGCSKQVRRHS